MNNKSCNRVIAEYLIENTEKSDIIIAVFEYFKLDCLERSNIYQHQLDAKIAEFNEAEGCDAEILTAIIDIVKAGRTNTRSLENDLIQRVVTYINAHLTEDISIEEISKEINISYYYMCHLFKSVYGVSVNTFRTQKRLEAAIKRLLTTDEKIADIAITYGFNNVSYFTEVFTKMVGLSPTAFKSQYSGIHLHDFYEFNDILSAKKYPFLSMMGPTQQELDLPFEKISVQEPNRQFRFLHEAAIIEYRGVLYASWYHCHKFELQGYTPIYGKRSYDGGKTWSRLELLCEDQAKKIIYCPPVYGICDDTLYLLVNQMVAPDHIHSLDLFRLNNDTGKFEFLWSRPIPFKLNTNVVALPNGKLMLPGRVGELDGFPNTPAVLISDSGKIDAEWRLVKIAENGDLPDGTELRHPEISVMQAGDRLYMFNRNDRRKVPLLYLSEDLGESWSEAYSHDIPYVNSKMYAGNLADGRKYLVANIDRPDRSCLAIYFTEPRGEKFTRKQILFDGQPTATQNAPACHYPVAHESNGKLYIIATVSYDPTTRGATLFIIDLKEL